MRVNLAFTSSAHQLCMQIEEQYPEQIEEQHPNLEPTKTFIGMMVRLTEAMTYGFPAEALRRPCGVVGKIGDALGEPIAPSDIEVCHCVPTREAGKSNIIVQFKGVQKRDTVLEKARKARVDIGSGVMVEELQLANIKRGCPGNPSKFARGLLCILFSPDELKRKSLFGRKCNAKKDLEAKDALDPVMVKAVIGAPDCGIQEQAKIDIAPAC
ncbi:hypothetical protein HPB52_014019 [Rhipicephalus sanguineus]|uniref:Uncharacterized protein n=1 Tax=Rhipicephalus sanguineus TaxID=34632 RepID=A0A9D4PXJ0_RHISA|nr:hypothetical protein HPB52_014019 [Rhipicephalus sanguineus]